MKIVQVSNFDLDTYTEKVIASGIENLAMARAMCDALNDKFSVEPQCPDYFAVFGDNYQPKRFEP